MNPVDLIIAKRNGAEHSREELRWLVRGFATGEVPDYQVAAWLMAAFLKGLSTRETFDLTMAIVDSGRHLDLLGVAPFVADKHSTGGVGDKTTLVVGPLVAAAGVPVGKMSGRGLGFSGGTLDKLESIPGFRVNLTPDEFVESIRKIGLVVAAQSPDLAPADGRLYSLRDVTGTVDSLPLIASSIMSKKIAAGATAVVLDVKVGGGAFMKTTDEARRLAYAMRDIGQHAGIQVRALLSDMDQPLGHAVGNALEVAEAVATLQGNGPADLLEVALAIGANLLQMAGKVESLEQGRAILTKTLELGAALAKLRAFVLNQGGDAAFIDDPSRLPQAPVRQELVATKAGYLRSVRAEAIGRASVAIGAGRQAKGDPIDPSVGFVIAKKVGERVAARDTLVTVHARSEADVQSIAQSVVAAFEIGDEPPEPRPVIMDTIS
jgi:pyrimidine-nucleoside phosphorylase